MSIGGIGNLLPPAAAAAGPALAAPQEFVYPFTAARLATQGAVATVVHTPSIQPPAGYIERVYIRTNTAVVGSGITGIFVQVGKAAAADWWRFQENIAAQGTYSVRNYHGNAFSGLNQPVGAPIVAGELQIETFTQGGNHSALTAGEFEVVLVVYPVDTVTEDMGA